MESYLKNWLVERQAQIPLPTLTITEIIINCEDLRNIYTTCKFGNFSQEIVFIKDKHKVGVIEAQFMFYRDLYIIE